MKRWHEEKGVMKRQIAKSKICSDKTFDGIGRVRKRHSLDCGKPRCGICHYAKYPKREKHEHEIRADISMREQMKERQ